MPKGNIAPELLFNFHFDNKKISLWFFFQKFSFFHAACLLTVEMKKRFFCIYKSTLMNIYGITAPSQF